jgi:bifunctional non-homologous end joining protein LigD
LLRPVMGGSCLGTMWPVPLISSRRPRLKHFEGIVTKRVDSPYLPGKRSPLWRKVKVRPRQEFVIGGWHPGERGLAGNVGSLLVGVYEGDRLRFADKVGTGFTDRERDRVGGPLG